MRRRRRFAREGRRRWPALALLALSLVLGPGMARASDVDPANDPRVREVARQVLCYCGCNSQSIADCACGVARMERGKIQARLDAGATTEEVVAEWVAERGTAILIEPPRKGFNLLGWFLPGALLLAAGTLLALTVRRWSRSRPAMTQAPQPDGGSPDPRYLEQLHRDLEKLGP